MFLTSRGTLASCPRQEETRDKRVPVAAAGSGPLAGKPAPEYPQVVRMSAAVKKSPRQSCFYCRKGNPFQGPKLGSCLALGNDLSKETHVLAKDQTQRLQLGPFCPWSPLDADNWPECPDW